MSGFRHRPKHNDAKGHHALAALLIFFAGSVMVDVSHTADERPDQSAQTAAAIARGEYLAVAADCGACHTVPAHKPFAGGLRIPTPLGDIYLRPTSAPSGGFRDRTLHRAGSSFGLLRHAGIRRDGANLYPAMPYTAYAKFTDDDAHALYAYFMQGVKPVDAPTPQTALSFPMNIRISAIGWNLPLPGCEGLRAGCAAIGGMESRRLPSRRRGALRHLPYAARLPDAGAGESGFLGRSGGAVVRAQHHVGSGRRHRQLDQRRARGLPAHGTAARKGAGGRKHGRGRRAQLPALCGHRPRRHRDLREEHPGYPQRGR